MFGKEEYTTKYISKTTFITLSILLGISFLALLGALIFIIALMVSIKASLVLSVIIVGGIIASIVCVVLVTFRFFNLYYRQKDFFPIEEEQYDYSPGQNYETPRILNETPYEGFKDNQIQNGIDKGIYKENPSLEEKADVDLVQESWLVENIGKLIEESVSSKCALIDISYNLGKETVSDRSSFRIYQGIHQALQYKGLKICFKDNKQGFFVFIPGFDSKNQLKEELEYLIRNISLLKRGGATKRVVMAHVSVVVYPYSAVENLFEDLSMVRKENHILNIYIPDKSRVSKKSGEAQEKKSDPTVFVKELATLDPDPKKPSSNIERIKQTITDIADNYGFELSGYVSYKRDGEIFVHDYVYSHSENPIFKEQDKADKKFIELLNEEKDVDSAYYFSSQKHLNVKVAKFVDRHHIRSGIFYVLTREQKPIGVLYFLNQYQDLELDDYQKGLLVSSCHVLGSMMKEIDARRNVGIADKRFSEILKISGMSLYTVNKETFELHRYSNSLARLFPSFDPNLPCYKAFYGLDKPCKNCPLKQRQHMLSKIGDKKYEVYPILTNKDDPTAHLLVQQVKEEGMSQRFDDETLLSSFSSFSADLLNQVSAGADGKILLLKIKNSREIISKIKTGGYISLIKELVDQFLLKYSESGEAYQYNNSTIALLMHGKSDEEIISVCQDICEFVKNFNLEGAKLSLVYLVKEYHPNDNVSALQKALLDGLDKYKGEQAEEIVFIDSGYKRSASLEGYLLEQLSIAFKNKVYEVEFTPLLLNNTRLIYGVEINLILKDVQIDRKLDMSQAVEIASKHGQGSIYSNGMLAYLDDLISKYTYTFFMASGISTISLKVNYDFVSQESFLEHLESLYKKHSLPKGFIAFEVEENDVQEHENEFAEIIKKSSSIGAKFIVYNYEGSKVSIDDLTEKGFKEIKFSEGTVLTINDQESYAHTTAIWLEAVKAQMKVNFCGVESRKTSEAIVFEGYDCGVQGDYYFKPMEENKAFETIRERNMIDKDNLDN